jgi:hypothetical protein
MTQIANYSTKCELIAYDYSDILTLTRSAKISLSQSEFNFIFKAAFRKISLLQVDLPQEFSDLCTGVD